MEEVKIKGFFERPEGKLGMVVIVLMAFGLMVGLDKIYPLIIRVLENTIYTGIMIAGILGVLFLISNKQVQQLVSNVFKNTMRFLTGLVIQIDPIGILKNYIQEMRDNIANIEKQIETLNGQKMELKRTIQAHKQKAESYQQTAQAAQKHNKTDQATLNARKMQREVDFVKNLQEPLGKMEMIYNVLDKMKRNVVLLMEDTEHEVEVREIKYKSIKAAHKAMSSAKKLISGSSEKEIFEQSMEFLAEDIAMKIGEMDRIMEASTDFMESVDLQNAVWDEKGLSTLAELEKGGSLFSYEEKKDPKPGISTNFSTDKAEFSNFFNTGNK